jgi:UDP-N-acetylglucosamine 4-epimerase
LNELDALLRQKLAPRFPHVESSKPIHQDFRPGDVRHSLADISKARRLLGYKPTHSIAQGLDEALNCYVKTL